MLDKQFNSIENIRIVDVGARFGLNTPWDKIDNSLISFMGFEPDIVECNKLNAENKNINSKFIPVGLSEKEQDNILYITEQPGCSSIFQPNYEITNKLYNGEQFRIVDEVKIKTMPLSKVLEQENFEPDFIKIDAQGAAFNILFGTGDCLSNVLMLEVEVEFSSIYKKEKLFSDIDQLVMSYNFQILDINRYYGKRKILPNSHSARGQVIFGDIIYYQPIDEFLKKNINNKDFKTMLIKYSKILSLYGYFDIALELIFHDKSPLNDLEKEHQKNIIYSKSKISKIVLFLFNNKISNFIGQLFMLIGNTLMIQTRISGWGSDYLNEDSRFKYYRSGPLSKYFTK